MKRYSCLGGLILACMPGLAMAQSAPPAEGADNPSDAKDIIVTAQRRAERLVDVPISVNVLGSGLVDQSQKMTVAASAMAEKNTRGHRS
ncbi:hypothetical protein F9288_13730 [Sphingomonas sp. CL5.1]|uniref:hypothetical protein n=1 Tax=Sphingomonas sp. CL5.1 TaxID=2653203 RepID=UPI00158218C2|nr:hypothetical protein [Sphingomonas sp. CL5.1]QKS00561.1 hypothetical protein F9288_13730 [Sphingomonas sp. CL5.1]